MIIFHEGLPRSGKSYEACVKHILPALEKGRFVYAYIDGLNHAKFAELLNKPVEEIRHLLHQVDEHEVKEIWKRIEKNDSLVVIDELQNFFPSGRQPLSPEITKFVTEHGHRGLDILCMGQNVRDCHSLWKRRVDTKIVFTKLAAVGMENRYRWEAFKAQSGEKYVKITAGVQPYEPKYFGLYKSHTDETANKGNYKDKRTNLFNSKLFRLWLPLCFGVAVFAVYHLFGFFGEDNEFVKNAKAKAPPVVPTAAPQTPQAPPVKVDVPVVQPAAIKPTAPEYIDYLDKMLNQYRPRLIAMVEGKGTGGRNNTGIVAFLDSGYRAQEQLTFDQIREFGWKATPTVYGVKLERRDKIYTVTAWPLDPFGAVAKTTQAAPQVSGKKE